VLSQQRSSSKASTPAQRLTTASEQERGDQDQERLGNAAVAQQIASGGGGGDADDPRDRSEKQADLDAAFEAGLDLISEPDALFEELEPELHALAQEHGLQWLRLVDQDGPNRVLDGKVNPQRRLGVVVLDHRDAEELALFARTLARNRRPQSVDIHVRGFVRAYGSFADHPWLHWFYRSSVAFQEYIQDLRDHGPSATLRVPDMPGPVPGGLRGAVAELLALETPAARGADKKDKGMKLESDDASSSDEPRKSISAPSTDAFESSKGALEAVKAQRQTKRSWTEEELEDIERLLQQLDDRGSLYVPDDDKATAAYSKDDKGRVEIRRVGAVDVPNNRLLTFATEYEYASGEYRYYVQMLNKAKPGVVPTLAKEPFTLRRRAAGGGSSSKGRSYRGTQGFFPNPDYWQKRKPDDSVPKPASRKATPTMAAILELRDAKDAATHGLVPQDAGPAEPWVFCVPDAFDNAKAAPDARQAGNPRRQRKQVGDFDKEASDKQVMRATVYQTRTPAQKRGDAGREPQTAAGGAPASAWMGAKTDKAPGPAYAASQGQLGSHEYCHLVGDGDSGDCSRQNLVVGTSGVNTEQLAMEETLRPFRPRLRALGYALRLSVTAIVSGTPFRNDDVKSKKDWPQDQMAEFIRYEMFAHPIDQALAKTEPIPVHTQVMDGQRGVITEAEVDMLKKTVSGKLELTLENLSVVEKLLTGERTDQPVDQAVYEDPERGRDVPMTPSFSLMDMESDKAPKREDKRRAPRDAVLRPGLEDSAPDARVDGGASIGRHTQGSFIGGGTACAGTSVRAAQRLLSDGFDDLDVDDTVQRGVSDYLAVRAEHPGAPPFLATYEMRTSPANQDVDLELIAGLTLRNGELEPLRDHLEAGLWDRAATLTAGAYTFTAARVGGVFCIFDSHANTIHERAYKQRFASMAQLMRGIKEVITQHGVNLHDDIAVEVYEEG